MTSRYSWPIIKLSIFAIICISLIVCLKFNPAPAQTPKCVIEPTGSTKTVMLRSERNRNKSVTVPVVLSQGTEVSTIATENDKKTTRPIRDQYSGSQGKWTKVKVKAQTQIYVGEDKEGYVLTSQLNSKCTPVKVY